VVGELGSGVVEDGVVVEEVLVPIGGVDLVGHWSCCG
jgi:hypothetical protein